jgi:glycosyltransferase involved in cell wall biosynthesis
MKILFVITRADTIAGAQLQVRDLARSLIQDGHQVFVVTGPSGIFNTTLTRCKIDYSCCNFLRNNINPAQDGQSLNFLIKAIRQFKPDIVSTHSSKAGFLGRLACKATNTPCLFTVQGWAFTTGIPEPKRTMYRWLEKMVEPLTNRIICASEYDRSIGIGSGMSANRLIKIYNGIADIPSELAANPSSPDVVRIAMVARFEPQKDHLTLLKAFQQIPVAQLDFLGDGPNLEVTKKQANELGIAERVNFLGYCPNVAQLLKQYQIFALASNWEGFPFSTLEAMRAGLPVVVSDVGGSAEAVVEGVTGFCIPRGDVEAWRNRLLQLVSNAALRKSMGIQGRRRYELEFTFEQMYKRTLGVYQQVLADRRND